MSDKDNSSISANKVFIRRGSNIARGFPVKLLIPYIEGKKLLADDEISGDGEHWTRLDRHQVLSRYFQNSPQIVPDAASPFPNNSAPLRGEAEAPRKPPGLEGELSTLAKMLEDLNR